MDTYANEYTDTVKHGCSKKRKSDSGTGEHGRRAKTKPAKKRKRNCDKWISTRRKAGKNKGEPYIGRNGQHVPGRIVGPPCKCGCFEKVGHHDKILEIFQNFWELGNYDLQNSYISKLVSTTDIQRSRIKGRASQKQRNIKYTVISDNKVHDVCRLAFYSIHGIKEKRVRSVLSKQTSTGVTLPDQRGHNSPRKKISDKRRQSVVDHIFSFPIWSIDSTSPYTKYLSYGLNKEIMYGLYLDLLKDSSSELTPVSKSAYHEIFNEFNLGFQSAPSDT